MTTIGTKTKEILSSVRRWSWSTIRRGVTLAIVLGVFLAAVPGLRPDPTSNEFQALGLARDHLFDFAAWEANALLDKALVASSNTQSVMTSEQRTQYVRDYFALVGEIQQLEAQVEEIYVDPQIADPLAASADLRAQRDALRADQQQRQALAEAIVQDQVSDVLVDYGFALPGGQLFPPVMDRFTQLPTIMIISPRDHIERTGAFPLEHGLTVDEMEQIEDSVDDELGVSTLIVPIGGLAVWPAMLIESSYTAGVVEVTAHEWTHHYLAFFPLGFNYGATRDLITINETVANIVGKEIGWATMERYYPDLAPPPPDYTPQPEVAPTPAPQDQEPPAFDFRGEMHETRVHVDDLLAAGRIDEAEQYMEQRRQMFVANGYQIRKLNQAYFAFYGSYADQPGATGSDPIGPALRELRYYSDSLIDYVHRVRGVTTFAEIQALLAQARAEFGVGR